MKFFSRFFSGPEEYFKELPLATSDWTVITYNWDLSDIHERKISLELNGKNQSRVVWNNKELLFSQNNKLRAYSHQETKNLKDLFNLSVHLAMKSSIESHFNFMRKTHQADINAETRSLQWIQASFKTLSGALDKVKASPELIFTAAFFSGVNPQLNQRVLRLICFNLDINFFMLEDDSLRIVVFDDKNLGHGGQQEPSFHQIIRLTKPLFYDEMIKLLQQVTSVGEVR